MFNFHKRKILHLRDMVPLMEAVSREASFSNKVNARPISTEPVSKFSVEYRIANFSLSRRLK